MTVAEPYYGADDLTHLEGRRSSRPPMYAAVVRCLRRGGVWVPGGPPGLQNR
jgi:hypothetical protein